MGLYKTWQGSKLQLTGHQCDQKFSIDDYFFELVVNWRLAFETEDRLEMVTRKLKFCSQNIKFMSLISNFPKQIVS